MAHRIRLGPPWEVATVGDRTRHIRKFGRPRTLDATERVWVLCDAAPVGTALFVNDVRVATAEGGPFAAEITLLLQPRNALLLDSPTSALLGEIALEIRTGE